MFRKEQVLFIVLSGFFITNAIVAEFIGAKLFSLEKTIGIEPFSFSFFGVNELAFNLTAGVLLWPVVFIMTDVINEYYGVKGVRMLSWLTAGLITFSFLIKNKVPKIKLKHILKLLKINIDKSDILELPNFQHLKKLVLKIDLILD